MGNRRRPTSAASAATPARKAAFELLRATHEQGTYLAVSAPRVLASHDLDPADKAFARLLAQGALSLQVTLDALIDRSLRSPRDIKPDVRDALRMSAYEILYLHKEDHAAVDQGVELVRWFAPRATGVANYVLHRIVEEKERFPFGDPAASLDAAALSYGFPQWLARAVKKDIGTRNAIALMKESILPAPVWFTNTCAFPREQLIAALEDAGIAHRSCSSLMAGGQDEEGSIFQLVHRSDVGSEPFLALLADDKVVISDLSAQSIASRAARALPNSARVLEIGAGRGTKTLVLQSACARCGIELETYDVLDISAKKLKELEARVARAGGVVHTAFARDARSQLPSSSASYDLVFIDAPCTGMGTLRRHPEIKARLAEGDSRSLAKIGQEMLARAAGAVRSGGALMYATCTIFKEENEKTVRRFLASSAGGDFEVLPIGKNGSPFFKSPIEQNGPDIHFAALLHRK